MIQKSESWAVYMYFISKKIRMCFSEIKTNNNNKKSDRVCEIKTDKKVSQICEKYIVVWIINIVRGWWLPDRASPGRCNLQSSALLNGEDPSVADGVVISSSANTSFIDSWNQEKKNCCFCAIINLQKKKEVVPYLNITKER